MKRDILTFLLFVVLAAAIWYGHAMQSVRNTRVPVLIQYTGKPGAIGLAAPGLPDTVLIEVRDAGARLNAYHRDPLRLTIDLHSYIHGEKGTIHVPSDALRRSLSDILQGTSRLIATQPEELTCKSSIWVEKEERRVNAKSLLGVLSLGIVKGTPITIIADGADEEEAIATLSQLIDSDFSE